MGVLAPAREGFDVDEVATDLLHERLEIGDGRDDAELVGPVRPDGGQEPEQHERASE